MNRDNNDDIARSRRAFFRRAMLRGIEKAEESGDRVKRRIDKLIDTVNPPEPYLPEPYEWVEPPRLLRPPGALPELEFSETCDRSGECVRACPAQCIIIDKDKAGGMPHVDAGISPCVVCDDLSCMKSCPSGALVLVADKADIKMGYGVSDHSRCLRGEMGEYDPDTGETTVQGEDCRICIEQCPFGEDAIGLDEYHGMVEVREACTGCGVCERVCPTDPKSIWVEPIEPLIDFPLNFD